MRNSAFNPMNNKPSRYWVGIVAIVSALGFVAVVLSLQLVQPDYQPRYQLMSELALGIYGWAMLFAFLCLALSVFAIQVGLATLSSSPALRAILLITSLCFAGAGIFRLGPATELHILLMAIAFILAGLAMYLLPIASPLRVSRTVSWGLAAGMVLSVTFGTSVLEAGIAQRLAASFLLGWVVYVGVRIAST